MQRKPNLRSVLGTIASCILSSNTSFCSPSSVEDWTRGGRRKTFSISNEHKKTDKKHSEQMAMFSRYFSLTKVQILKIHDQI
jgi:hypothetical protein